MEVAGAVEIFYGSKGMLTAQSDNDSRGMRRGQGVMAEQSRVVATEQPDDDKAEG